MIDVRFSPMPTWPHAQTLERRSRNTFKASWNRTLQDLDKELRLLEASEIIIGVQMQPRHIRLDGWPRGDAPHPLHPGVEVSFESALIGRLDPTVRRGLELITRHGSARAAEKATHPDAGGTPADFVAVQAATDPTRRLVYATDACDFWQHNVRSIALGLEALRAVDRYGISRRGEQYAGYRAALTAGASS
jgi:hypothetical protein